MAGWYAAHRPAILAFAHRHVASARDAEDVVQETFLRGWRRLDSLVALPDDDAVRAYLVTTARHVVTDRWRAAQRRPATARLDEARPSTTDDLDASLDRWLVVEALRRLSREHADVVWLLYFRGLSVREAAARLGVPEGTVKSRSYYAVRALRAAFEEWGVSR